MSGLIRLVISDTGSGHRACADALVAALDGRADVDIVDPLARSGVPGVRSMSAIYDWFGDHRETWGLLWRVLDGPLRARLLSGPVWWTAPQTYVELINAGDPDLVIVLHPYLANGTRRALRGRRNRTQLATVVTDPVTPHASWFEPDVDRLFVATAAAHERARECGVARERIERIGHPIHPRVHGLARERASLRARYGWAAHERVVLLTGTRADIERGLTAARGCGARVVVVAGRDRALRERLSSEPDVEILGFVDDLPERMCAADVVLSKAGPSTLAECRAVGTPVLVTSHMPGQEDGNLGWVAEHGSGEVAEEPVALALALRRWLADEDRRTALRAAAIELTEQPVAVTIAERLLELMRLRQERGLAWA